MKVCKLLDVEYGTSLCIMRQNKADLRCVIVVWQMLGKLVNMGVLWMPQALVVRSDRGLVCLWLIFGKARSMSFRLWLSHRRYSAAVCLLCIFSRCSQTGRV